MINVYLKCYLREKENQPCS